MISIYVGFYGNVPIFSNLISFSVQAIFSLEIFAEEKVYYEFQIQRADDSRLSLYKDMARYKIHWTI